MSTHSGHYHDCVILPMNRWHGDVKPENILNILGARPKFKLADFGFFKFKKKLLEWGADQGTLPEVNMGAGTTAYGKNAFIQILSFR